MAGFGPESTIWDVVHNCAEGRRLLYKYGYDLGEGFTDVLSQYVSLREVAWEGRLRNLRRLIEELNHECGPERETGGRDKPSAAERVPAAAAQGIEAGRGESPAGARAAVSSPATAGPGARPRSRHDRDRPAGPATVVGLFVSPQEAERAAANLIQAGFPAESIGYLEPEDLPRSKNPAERAVKGAVVGGIAGAVVGALLAAAAVGLFPGLGQVLTGGAVVPLLIGAILVGSTGAIVGGLLGAEGSSEEVLYFVEEVEAGRALLAVEVPDQAAEEKAFGVLRARALEVDSLGGVRLHARLRHPDPTIARTEASRTGTGPSSG